MASPLPHTTKLRVAQLCIDEAPAQVWNDLTVERTVLRSQNSCLEVVGTLKVLSIPFC